MKTLPKRQRGIALLLLIAALSIGASWYMVKRLNQLALNRTAVDRQYNVQVLNRAKQALIGYVAAQAGKAGENNPGNLPCPENPGDFDSTTGREGLTGTACGSSLKIGRFPWRTIGTEKFVDAAGEPLWYVVSPSWGVPSSGNTLINSNSVGGLTLDGAANAAVALIVAPGPAVTVAASSGCAAWTQTRSASGSPDFRNYLECENATSPADVTFVTTNANGSFNDQVVAVTAADLLPGVEAAIADRVNREILPALQTVYTPSAWGFSGSNPVLPFATPFGNPGTSNYQGAAANNSGLLPFNQTQSCTPATDPRCTTTLLTFAKSGSDIQTGGSGSIRTQSSCAWQSNVYVCTGQYNQPSISLSFSFNVTNVAMGLRSLDLSKVTCTAVDDVGAGIPMQTVACATSVALQSNGSATFTVSTASLPDISASGWGTYANYMINIDKAVLGDHALLSSSDATTGWFVRNEWYRLLYYAAAPSNTAARLPLERSCTTAGDCLTVTNMAPSTKKALLILAGRSLNGSARPSSTLADYLEFGNAGGSYEKQTVTTAVPAPYADTGGVNAYAIALGSVAAGAPIYFKAANTNTAASTLTTAATGARPIVNSDGSALSAGEIVSNAAVQVAYDGTKFVLYKRPFNDRFVAASSN